MATLLRAVILADDAPDAEMIGHELRQSGFDLVWERVGTEAQFSLCLKARPDIIFSNHAMRNMSALQALSMLQERNLDIPLIVVTGPIGDEPAVQCLQHGAADVVLKESLGRLGESVRIALAARSVRQERKRAEEYIRSIINSSLDMIITTDYERKIVEFNRAAEETFGYRRDQVLGKHIGMLYADWDEGQNVHQTVMRLGKMTREIMNKRRNGEVFPSLLSASVLRDAHGELLGVLGISRDITEQKKTEEKLRYMSMHDTLTNLYNRAYFEEEMARLERGRQFPVSVIMIDVDGLKMVNDNLGHATGDECLRQSAKLILASFRTEDIVARIGGDEFAVLLPGTNAAMTLNLVGRMRGNLGNYNRAHGGLSLSLSIGAATAEQGQLLSDTLKQADQFMYREKNKRPPPAT